MKRPALINGKEYEGVSTADQALTEKGSKVIQQIKTMNLFFLVFVFGFINLMFDGYSMRIRVIVLEKAKIVKQTPGNEAKSDSQLARAFSEKERKEILIEALRTISKENLLLALCCVVFMATTGNVVNHLKENWNQEDYQKSNAGQFIVVSKPASRFGYVLALLNLPMKVYSTVYMVKAEKDGFYVVENGLTSEVSEIKIFDIHTNFSLKPFSNLTPLFVEKEETVVEMFPGIKSSEKKEVA